MSPGDWLIGLPAQVRADCRVLVLGSMPGAASLAADRYYAHPRNRFWPLMQRLAGVDAGADYPQRIAALQQAGMGLWDVIGTCRRRGSLDTAIVAGSEQANALPELIGSLPSLRAVAFNGGKAAQAFARHVAPRLPDTTRASLHWHALPSTSPAHAATDLEGLLQRWSVLAADLRP